MIFTDLLNGKTLEKPPVWIMRQAGRYLPEYREVRKSADNFIDFCLTPEKACEATLQPIRKYDFDASIIFGNATLTAAIGYNTLLCPLLLLFVIGQEESFFHYITGVVNAASQVLLSMHLHHPPTPTQ